MSVQHINSEENASFSHILSHATKIPGLVFVSGQVPIDSSGNLVQGTIEDKTAACISNVGNVLKASGTAWENVVKVNIYLKDINDFAAINVVYEKLIPSPKPARTCIQAAKLPRDVDIEIEAIATV